MSSAGPSRRLAVFVPSLGERAARDESTVRLLLTTAHMSEAAQQREIVVVALDRDLGGWSRLNPLMSEPDCSGTERGSINAIALTHASPAAPFGRSVEAAYDANEFLLSDASEGRFDEVHVLDRGGVAAYMVTRKHLGLGLLDTAIVVHVVGGTLLAAEREDRLIDTAEALVADKLERSCMELADAFVVHDRSAWERSQHATSTTGHGRAVAQTVTFLDRPVEGRVAETVAVDAPSPQRPPSENADTTVTVAYFGRLSPASGVSRFCDAIDKLQQSDNVADIAILFVGEPAAMGGLDAATYVWSRASSWSVPVELRRDLAIADEVELLKACADVVVVDGKPAGGLRSMLVPKSCTRLETDCEAPDELSAQIQRAVIVARHQSKQPHAALTSPETDAWLQAEWRRSRMPIGPTEVPSTEPLSLRTTGPLVSVCVVHHERPAKLRVALDSLRAQTYGDFEVVVVDDGSTDPHVLAELADIEKECRTSGWRVIRQTNRYLGAARNHAARAARGEYLLFMDDDNAARPHELEVMVAVAQRTRADVVTSFYDGFETDEDLISEHSSVRFTPVGADATLGLFTNCFGDANSLWRRDAFESLGGFTEDYGITHEDWELFCRAELSGLNIVCVPEPLFWYRIDPEGMFRGRRRMLHESANHRRHLRPFIESLPPDQARLAQLAHGMMATLGWSIDCPETRDGRNVPIRPLSRDLPFGRVAIVMRTKDRPIMLERAIRSVAEQTFGDWLLVVVNDGGDRAIVEAVANGFAGRLNGRLIIVHNASSLGMQNASNVGISRSDSEYITIHDDDDSWEPRFLERMVSCLDRRGWDPKSGAAVCHATLVIEHLDPDGRIELIDRTPFDKDLQAINIVDMAVSNQFPPISLVFRRTTLDAIGHFDERFGPIGDWDFHLRLAAAFDIDVLQEPLANYHHRPRGTAGTYGNSVHDGHRDHQVGHTALLNQSIRSRRPGIGEDSTLSDLLVHGHLHQRQVDVQTAGLQRVHQELWAIDQRAGRTEELVRALFDTLPSRNLITDGDFRRWKGRGPAQTSTDGSFTYVEITPSCLICFGFSERSFEVECRMETTGARGLPDGKSVLRLTKSKSRPEPGDWFAIEFDLDVTDAISLDEVTVSALLRMETGGFLIVTGRHELADGRTRPWGEAKVWVGAEFDRIQVTIPCPVVLDSSTPCISSRAIFLLPASDSLTFEVTDVQVERGAMASAFEYRAPGSSLDWLRSGWNKSLRADRIGKLTTRLTQIGRAGLRRTLGRGQQRARL